MNKDTLEFVEKCAEAFEKNGDMYTFRDDNYIGLRYGFDEDCIKVFRIGSEVGFFENWFPTKTDSQKLEFAIKLLDSIKGKLSMSDRQSLYWRLQTLLKLK